ncbi:MAG: hypothetical protein Q9227_004390 [Pyrenula ochraceoflavens]
MDGKSFLSAPGFSKPLLQNLRDYFDGNSRTGVRCATIPGLLDNIMENARNTTPSIHTTPTDTKSEDGPALVDRASTTNNDETTKIADCLTSTESDPSKAHDKAVTCFKGLGLDANGAQSALCGKNKRHIRSKRELEEAKATYAVLKYLENRGHPLANEVRSGPVEWTTRRSAPRKEIVGNVKRADPTATFSSGSPDGASPTPMPVETPPKKQHNEKPGEWDLEQDADKKWWDVNTQYVGELQHVLEKNNDYGDYGVQLDCFGEVPKTYLRSDYLQDNKNKDDLCGQFGNFFKIGVDLYSKLKKRDGQDAKSQGFLADSFEKSVDAYSDLDDYPGFQFNLVEKYPSVGMHLYAKMWGTVPSTSDAKAWGKEVCTGLVGLLATNSMCIEAKPLSKTSDAGEHWAMKGGMIHVTHDTKPAEWNDDGECTNCLVTIAMMNLGTDATMPWLVFDPKQPFFTTVSGVAMASTSASHTTQTTNHPSTSSNATPPKATCDDG